MARQIAIECFVVLFFGLVLGLFGPFGTFEMDPAIRIAFWMGYTLLGYAIFRPIVVAGKWMSDALGLPNLIGVGLALVIAAVPLTFLIALLFAGFDAGKALRAKGLGTLFFDVWLIGFLINGFFALAFREKPVPEAEAAPASLPQGIPAPDTLSAVNSAPPSPERIAFEDRLPKGFGPLLALKGEDHYVRAFGDAREELILFRLRDAIAELGATDGMQVHRSWWVARAAVASVKRDGRSATLHLTNGTEVPVARDKLADLKRAGWR